MDQNLLEFWGNFLLSAARKKKQMDDVTTWMQKGVSGFDELTAMFRKFYGLDQMSEQSGEYKKMTEKAMQDFQQSFKEYMGTLDFVPRREHLSLVEKYEKLKEKCTDQEETIKHLKMLLNAKGIDQFQDLIKDQGELFQNMIKSFGQCFSSPDKPDSEKEAPEKQAKTNLKGDIEKNDRTDTNV
jgi:soluble cytochrome b562